MISADFTIWGKHALELALQSPWTQVHDIKIETKDFDSISKWAQSKSNGKRLNLKSVSSGEIAKSIKTDQHQNVIARVTLRMFETIKEWSEAQTNTKIPWLGLALDEVQDPQNVGTLIRAATFFGANFILMTKDRSAALTGVVAKASSGGLFALPIIRATNLSRELQEAVALNFWRIGLDADAEKDLSLIKVNPSNVMLILGNEGEGLRQLTRKNCDEIAKLHRIGPMESLNVAVAGAVSLYEVVRERIKQ
jgi:23S rRNA (guanosine2251-2'-O)-methyltransferase